MKVIHLRTTTIAAITLFALGVSFATSVSAQDLSTFGVLAGSSITNTDNTLDPTTINGNVGLSPSSSITGFSCSSPAPWCSITPATPTVVSPYQVYQTDAIAAQAQVDLTIAYSSLAVRPPTSNLTGQDLAGHTLTPGVYKFDTSAGLTGTLTLNGQGNPNALFIFVIGSTLTTASASHVILENSAQGANVFFVVGSSATLGTTTAFQGQILALTSITLNTDASILCGAALARNGAVTLDSNKISICGISAATFGPPGEAGSGVVPTGIQAMNSFLSLLNSRFGESGPPNRPGAVTVKALGYAPEGSMPQEAGSALAYFDNGPVGVALDPGRWSAWAATYGGQNNTAGDASAGTHDRSASTFGFATGFENRVTPDTSVGFALAAGGTNFGLSDGLGGGRSDTFQAGVYSRTNFNAAYVASELAYAWDAVSTHRFVSPDHLSAAFSAQDVAGQIEGGYRFGWFTPYAALRAQAFFTPAYRESPSSSVLALHYAALTTTMIRTEFGAKIDRTFALDNDATLALSARVAWAHDYWSNTSLAAMFLSLPGSSFTVNGAAPASDSLLLSAGTEIRFRNGFSVAGLFDSEFARNSQTYAGTARLRYTW